MRKSVIIHMYLVTQIRPYLFLAVAAFDPIPCLPWPSLHILPVFRLLPDHFITPHVSSVQWNSVGLHDRTNCRERLSEAQLNIQALGRIVLRANHNERSVAALQDEVRKSSGQLYAVPLTPVLGSGLH